ncbi:hypothetical protein WI89_08080 [Burkholderia ubonensis]|nr:hypothetical protein WI89_08080 [Burkholderia ubonensis]
MCRQCEGQNLSAGLQFGIEPGNIGANLDNGAAAFHAENRCITRQHAERQHHILEIQRDSMNANADLVWIEAFMCRVDAAPPQARELSRVRDL